MSRTSRVPYHQNVYDLLAAEEFAAATRESRQCDAWESETRLQFPASMREVYAQFVYPHDEAVEQWVTPPTLRRWWATLEQDDYICRLDELLQPDVLWDRVPTDALSGRYFGMVAENQACWLMYARHDGSDDPQVFVTRTCFLSPGADWSSGEWPQYGWHCIGSFSDVVWRWFFDRLWRRGALKAVSPNYANGLWLRTPAEPFAVPVIDFLAEQFGEPERTPRDGDVTAYTWRPDGGTVRVTADDPAHPDPLSAWWIHAASAEQLAEYARLLRPWGTLAQTLRADTEEARAVWDSAGGNLSPRPPPLRREGVTTLRRVLPSRVRRRNVELASP